MTVVLNSNAVVALVTKDERAEAIGRQMRAWDEAGEDLHAPWLLRYEVANALTRKVVAKRARPRRRRDGMAPDRRDADRAARLQ